jgi:MYXO-CTERM domain-containing protein
MDSRMHAGTALAASFLTALLLGSSCMVRTAAPEMDVSAIAAFALLGGGLLLERSLAAAWRRTLSRGDAVVAGGLFGLPLSYFLLQVRTAESVGDVATAEGASRAVGAVGLVLLLVAAIGAWRRRQRT